MAIRNINGCAVRVPSFGAKDLRFASGGVVNGMGVGARVDAFIRKLDKIATAKIKQGLKSIHPTIRKAGTK